MRQGHVFEDLELPVDHKMQSNEVRHGTRIDRLVARYGIRLKQYARPKYPIRSPLLNEWILISVCCHSHSYSIMLTNCWKSWIYKEKYLTGQFHGTVVYRFTRVVVAQRNMKMWNMKAIIPRMSVMTLLCPFQARNICLHSGAIRRTPMWYGG